MAVYPLAPPKYLQLVFVESVSYALSVLAKEILDIFFKTRMEPLSLHD